jgi:hypothetical protein
MKARFLGHDKAPVSSVNIVAIGGEDVIVALQVLPFLVAKRHV